MKPIHFEMATYVGFIVIMVLVATVFRGRRDYWYALFGCLLLFPFEWIADKFWMFLDYDWGFVMMVDRLPLMMPFAWGWFMGFTLILCIQFQDKIDAMPWVRRVIFLYAVFWLWDLVVEYSSTSFLLWDYHWKKEHMIGGILPWFIPTTVAFANVMLYFGHKIAVKKSSEKNWFHGFGIHVLTYYIVFIIQMAIGWPIIKIWGIEPVFGQ